MSVTLVTTEAPANVRNDDFFGDWLFESSPDCVKVMDTDGNLLAMNRNGLCSMEIDDFSTVCGAAWASLWGSPAHGLVGTALAEARAGRVGHFSAFGATAKGSPRWWDVMVTPVRDRQGVIVKLLSVSRDVTPVHVARLDAQLNEARFRSVVKAVSAIVWATPPSGEFDAEQPEWSAFTGQSFEQLKGIGWLDAVHPEDRAQSHGVAQLMRHGTAPFNLQQRLLRADGVYRDMRVQVVPVFDADGLLQEWFGVHTDITAEVQSAKALTARDDRIRLATDVAGLGIWTWHSHTDQITWENERGWKIFGLPHADEPMTVAQFAGARLHADDIAAFETALRTTLDSGARFHFQGRIHHLATGQLRWIELSGESICGEDGATGILGAAADITERKKSEDLLRQSAEDMATADRRKTEFIVTLAHELRNPLAPIRNGLQVLKMAADNPSTVARVRGVMERQVSQMVHLIDDLLDVARISRGQIDLKKEAVDLKKIAANAVETSLPQIEAGLHELSINMTAEPLPLLVDPARIAQVISNLLNNAAKYTPRNGRIFLTAERDDRDVVITVTDSGVGIPAKALPNVFELFAQVEDHKERAQGGLGIGLSLVRNLVRLHGGTVAAFSEGEGLGSSFVVRLPLAG